MKHEYKKGDKVIVVDRKHYHGYGIGETVILGEPFNNWFWNTLTKKGRLLYILSEDEFEPARELSPGQNLFETLQDVYGFPPLEGEMWKIIHAIKKDNEL